jgi:putative addiction module CopG family antidote
VTVHYTFCSLQELQEQLGTPSLMWYAPRQGGKDMTIHLPEDLERYLQSQVQCGNFASEDEAIIEAVRLLREAKQRAASTRSKPLSEEELERQMAQSGFLTRPLPATSHRDFHPITSKGEPLSETITRERR